MPRPVRYHRSFQQDLVERVRWLRTNRPSQQVRTLREAIAGFRQRVGAHPGVGHEEHRIGARSFRVFRIGGRLPYLIWYYLDENEPDAPVWLAMLLHEAQDRERFDPSRFRHP